MSAADKNVCPTVSCVADKNVCPTKTRLGRSLALLKAVALMISPFAAGRFSFAGRFGVELTCAMSSAQEKSGRVSTERSAGVILFREDGARRVFLLLDYGRYWDYPKGHVEKGEDDRGAALRELAEETGITDVEILPDFSFPITYFFRHPRKGLVRKTVMFFLARTSTECVTISDEHVGHVWLPAAEAMKRLKYSTARKVFRAAREFLDKL
jgi:8-oxo-dGTP pyrophosphatase MutT (NUDIX family)